MMDNNGCKAAEALEPITSIKEEQRNKKQKYVQIKDGPQSTVYLNKKTLIGPDKTRLGTNMENWFFGKQWLLKTTPF